MFAEIWQVQDHRVYKVGKLLLLCTQVVSDVGKVAIFEIGALDKFGQHIGYLAAIDF